MSSTDALTFATSVVGVLFGILAVVIGWIGSRITAKQDEMMNKIDAFRDEIHIVKYELNDRINSLDIRIVRIETIIDDDHR